MTSSCENKKCGVVTAVCGLALIIGGVAIIFVVDYVQYVQVLKNVLLSENAFSIPYSYWKQPHLPVYMQFYVFDLKNPMEVLDGNAPYLKQKGPYTYREEIVKVDIVYHENDTVSYRQIKTWHFVPEMSCDDNDKFTTANIPLLTLVEALRWEDETFQEAAALLLKLFSESLFITRSVHDIVWGYEDALLAAGKRLLPNWITSDFLGVFSDKNNTDDGVYTIFTGQKDWRNLGRINRYNYSGSLSYWSDEYANQINGSDGTLFPPFLEKDAIMYSFVSDICRSVYAVYAEETQLEPSNINVWRYTATAAALQSGATNPDNAGFCTPSGNCMADGVLNLTQCRMFDAFHIPIIASFPHFYMADERYLKAVVGLAPDALQHRSDLLVEPITGLPMRLYKRLQVNVYIQSNKFVSEMGKVKSMVYPILWLNESLVVDEDNLNQINALLFVPVLIAQITEYVAFALGIILLLVAVYTLRARTTSRDYVPINADNVLQSVRS